MKLKDILERIPMEVKAGRENLDREVKGGYVSDLLSDVMANSKEGDIWVTLQVHQNIVAVAQLKEIAGIAIINNREPEPDTIEKANREGIPIMVTPLSGFELVGRLYEMGISRKE
jgi:hypothetical protein